MFHEIDPHQYSLQYKHITISDSDYVIIGDFNQSVLLINNKIPTYSLLKDQLKSNYQYLFSIDDDNYFMFYDQLDGEYTKVRQIIKTLPSKDAFACATGHHLYSWYYNHQYCGICKNKLVPHKTLRALYCENCKQLLFPTISPAVIIGIVNEDKILMSQYAGREYKGNALIAGFCEIGETVEETCKRETMEEVGLKIKDIEYFKSQPWGVDSTLLLGFFAKLDGDDHIEVDHQELEKAMWVSAKDIDPNDNPTTLTATMIEHFRKTHL